MASSRRRRSNAAKTAAVTLHAAARRRAVLLGGAAFSALAASHGEAVATGVLLDSIYAEKKGWIERPELESIRNGLFRSGFRLWFEEFERRDGDGIRTVFGGLRDFQEHLGGELTVTFPLGIGARHEVHEIDLALMEDAVNELGETVRSR